MAAESSWSLRGVDPRAREAARTAARKEGVTVGEWINRQLLQDEAARRRSEDPAAKGQGKPASKPDDIEAIAWALDRLSRRIEAAEHRSTLAITGIDQSVLSVITRLQNAEEAQGDTARRYDGAIDTLRETQSALAARIAELESDAAGERNLEALKSLEAALARVASQVSEVEERSAKRLGALEGSVNKADKGAQRAEKLAADAAKKAEEAVLKAETAASEAKNELGKLRTDVGARSDALAHSVAAHDAAQSDRSAGIERAMKQITDRLGVVEQITNDSLKGLEARFASLDDRMRVSETRLEDIPGLVADSASTSANQAEVARLHAQSYVDARVDGIDQRFEELSRHIAEMVANTRVEIARQLQDVAQEPRIEAVEAKIARVAEHVAQAERRHFAILDRIGDEVARMAGAVETRLKQADNRSAERAERTERRVAEIVQEGARRAEQIARAAASDLSGVDEIINARLRQIEVGQAHALERVGHEMAMVAERMSERIAAAERRSTEALEDVGGQVSRLAEKIELRAEDGESLSRRLQASEERTARMVESAMDTVHRRFEESRDALDEGLSPVQRALQALSERLEAIERAPPPAAGRGPAIAAPAGAEVAPPPFDDGGEDEHNPDAPTTRSSNGPFVSPASAGGADFALGLELDEDDVPPVIRRTPPLRETLDSLGPPHDGLDAFDDLLDAASPGGTGDSLLEGVRATRDRGAASDRRFGSEARPGMRPAAGTAGKEKMRAGAKTEPPTPGFGPAAPAAPKRGRRLLMAASGLAFLAVGAAFFLVVQEGDRPAPGGKPREDDPARAPAKPPRAPEASARSPEAATPAPARGAIEAPVADAPAASEPQSASSPPPARAIESVGLVAPSPVAPAAAAPPPGLAPPASDLEAAAARGEPIAQFQLGSAKLETGDAAAGAALIRSAAEQGIAPAQYRLAKLYEAGAGGLGVDERAALDWTKRAAEAGHRRAIHNLGIYHAEGRGTPQDFAEAARWFERAAILGAADSQYNLAVLYEQGLGVPLSLPDAYAWFLIAGQSGDSDAAAKAAELGGRLTPEAKAAADKTAARFQSRRPDDAANGVFRNLPWSAPTADATAAIARAQSLLAKLGYTPGPADGAIGPMTRDAVIAYQRKSGMPETGRVDATLLKRLEADAAL